MHSRERGRAFLQSLHDLAGRSAWDWRRCPCCGGTQTSKWGSSTRRPWTLAGRQTGRVQRHRCAAGAARRGQHTTSHEESAWLVRGSWYAREVHRCAIDRWQHLGSSLRRVAEDLRSWLGRQERWRLWRPLDPPPPGPEGKVCFLGASTVHRWLDGAGRAARPTVIGQLEGVPTSGQCGADGLWARLRGKTTEVVLVLVDSVTGVVWPPVVVVGEEAAASWGRLFRRARVAGLDVHQLRGLTSDGARGLLGYLRAKLRWVSHQRCVFHVWRNLAGELAQAAAAAATGLAEALAKEARQRVRAELVALVHGVLDARDAAALQTALVALAAHQEGAGLARALRQYGDALFSYQCGDNTGLHRVGPEWLWRDFRLRLSHGRNHGSDRRLERAALVWAIYRNFEPAQRRCERRRKYRYPGQCPLAVAGVPPGEVSYLDALGV